MSDATTKCEVKRIYPVRYALTSEEEPPIAKHESGNFKSGKQFFTSYYYTLRTLREGYIHLYMEELNEYRSYKWDGNTFNQVTRESAASAELNIEDGTGGNWINIPMEVTKIAVNFAEVLWDDEFWQQEVLGGTLKTKRMTSIELVPELPKQHTAKATEITTLVEEHRSQSMGFLDCMREILPTIFRPAEDYKKIPPNELTISDSWKHSAVLMHDKLDQGKHNNKNYEQRSDWVITPVQQEEAEQCPSLLVAVEDLIGVGRDIAHIYQSSLVTLGQYLKWYSQPYSSAKFLQQLDKEYRNDIREAKFFPLSRSLFVQGIYFPKRGPWQSFLENFEENEKEITKHLKLYCRYWQVWIRTNLISIFKDFPSHTWKEKEEAFAACHLDMALHETGKDIASKLYLNTGITLSSSLDNAVSTGVGLLQQANLNSTTSDSLPDLLANVLIANSNSAKKATVDILTYLNSSFLEFVKNNPGYNWGYLQKPLEGRLTAPVRIQRDGSLYTGLKVLREEASALGHTATVEFLDNIFRKAQNPISKTTLNELTWPFTTSAYEGNTANTSELFDIFGDMLINVTTGDTPYYTLSSTITDPNQAIVQSYVNTAASLVSLPSTLKNVIHEPNCENIILLINCVGGFIAEALWVSTRGGVIGIGIALSHTLFALWIAAYMLLLLGRPELYWTKTLGTFIGLATILYFSSFQWGSKIAVGINNIVFFAIIVLDIFYHWLKPNRVEKWILQSYWGKAPSYREHWKFTYVGWSQSEFEYRQRMGEAEARAIRNVLRVPQPSITSNFSRSHYETSDSFTFEVCQLDFDYNEGELTAQILAAPIGRQAINRDLLTLYPEAFTKEVTYSEKGVVVRYTVSRGTIWNFIQYLKDIKFFASYPHYELKFIVSYTNKDSPDPSSSGLMDTVTFTDFVNESRYMKITKQEELNLLDGQLKIGQITKEQWETRFDRLIRNYS